MGENGGEWTVYGCEWCRNKIEQINYTKYLECGQMSHVDEILA